MWCPLGERLRYWLPREFWLLCCRKKFPPEIVKFVTMAKVGVHKLGISFKEILL
jgi:hypothetical protein